ncbi:MAG: hypothetical protein ACTSU2_13215 [Promethearchaeota archaeon]
MSMPGLKSSILRVVGKVLNLIAMILFIVANFIINPKLLTANISNLIGIGLIMALFYIEIDFVDDNRHILMGAVNFAFILLSGVSIGIQSGDLGLNSTQITLIILLYAFEFLSPYYQQYSLSIYKKEKLFFIIAFSILEVFLVIYQIVLGLNGLLILIQVLLALGLIMILIIENKMRAKKLLNYI